MTHPCRIVIVGRSQSGKTTLAMDIIQYLIPQVDEVCILKKEWRRLPSCEFYGATRSRALLQDY